MAQQEVVVRYLPKQQTETVSVDARETGVMMGFQFRNFITGETFSVNPVSYRELRRMCQEDATARATLSMVVLPIRAANWDINDEDDEGHYDATKSPTPECKFLRDMFFKPPREGGMKTPFNDVIEYMAYSVRDGFKVFERVYEQDDRGRIVLSKIAYRENDTVTIIMDEHGEYNGFRQITQVMGQMVDVIFKKEKTVHFVYGRVDNHLYGTPLFLPVYYHFDKKQKLYYISHVAFQILAVPPRIGTMAPNVSDKKIQEKFLNDLASIGFNSAMTIKDGFKVEPFESKRSLADFMPLINHHDHLMSKAVLGQFIDLARSSTGMLSQEQSDLFILSLVSFLRNIEDKFNHDVIPDLIDLNFNSKHYPKLRALPFTDKQQDAINTIFKEIMTSGPDKVSPEFMLELEKKLSAQLELNIDYTKAGPRELKQRIDMKAAALDAQKNVAAGINANPSGGSVPGPGRPNRGGGNNNREGNG